ncbi:MAG: deoxynucleoside kinase [Clostridia bacterium]|nr:deoxynucleoside kinase [Clostridia bacterium]
MSTFIAIDGLDGSGKETQSTMLVSTLKINDYAVRYLSFPMYESESSALVRMYLDGKLGSRPSDTNAYAASTFFACDRYASYKSDWKNDYDTLDKIIVANRYTSANAVHQLLKMPREDWNGFLDWLWDFEFIKLGLPTPDLVIYLELLPEHSAMLVNSRSDKTGRVKDIHEKDADFMRRSYEAAQFASEKLGWTKIKCYDSNGIRPRADIFKDIISAVVKKTGIIL